MGSSLGKGGRCVFRHITLLGAQVHGAYTLLEPVRVQPKLLEKLHEPVTGHGIAPFRIGNTGLTDVQNLGQLNLRAAVGGQLDAFIYLCKTGHNSLTPGVENHASMLLIKQRRFVGKHQLAVLF